MILIVGLAICGLAVLLGSNYWNHKERMKKIEMGIDPDKDES